MSSQPPDDSRAPYIIICNGQTALAFTEHTSDRIKIAAATAKDMVAYLGAVANDDLTTEDTKPISDCLHWFENNVGAKKEDQEAKVTELIGIVDGLHRKFSAY